MDNMTNQVGFINKKFGDLLDAKLTLMKLMSQDKMEYDEKALQILNSHIRLVKNLYPKEDLR